MNNFLRTIIAFVVIATIVAFGFYIKKLAIDLDYVLSDKQEVWGQFGAYIGGILNPFFVFSKTLKLIAYRGSLIK